MNETLRLRSWHVAGFSNPFVALKNPGHSIYVRPSLVAGRKILGSDDISAGKPTHTNISGNACKFRYVFRNYPLDLFRQMPL
jgi:hypothetical protein